MVKKSANANYEEQGRAELMISDKTVQKIMGPQPIPHLEIEVDEIQNELQIKLVEEVSCISCHSFPFDPMECRSCNGIFCKYCQVHLFSNPRSANPGDSSDNYEFSDPEVQHRLANMSSIDQRKAYIEQLSGTKKRKTASSMNNRGEP